MILENRYVFDTLPSNWVLTPVKDKKPYRTQWQNEEAVSRDFILSEIKNKNATGFGLRTGTVSGCVLAIDFDGESAIELMMNLPNYHELPKTPAWSSGKTGRVQSLFKIPEKFRKDFEDFNNMKVKEYKDFKCAEGEQIEFRYNVSQSVLPPSKHPETSQYQWVNSPQDTQIADLPQFIIDFLLPIITPQRTMNNSPYERYLTDLDLPINVEIPLEICLAKKSRELLVNGVGQGSRDDSGASLIRDLLGTANYLDNLGQSYNGDPYDLLFEFGSKCSPPLKPKDCDRIYKSAQKNNPKPCLDEEKIKGCIGAWYWANSDVKKAYITTKKVEERKEVMVTKNEPKLSKIEAVKEAKTVLMADHDEIATNILLDDIRKSAGISEYGWDNKFVKPLRRQVKETKLKLEISLYTQESDVFKKVQLKQKICSNYSLNTFDFQLLVDYIEQSHNIPEKKVYSFEELMECETIAENWLIPSIIPVGEMLLLTALPKVGKTLLANDVAFAVLSGSEVLGEKATKGKVLYIGSDESKGSLVRRFQSRGFDLLPECKENLRVMTHLDLSNMGELEGQLEDFKPDLVVIDSLTSISLNLNISENDAEFAKNIYRLKDLMKKYNCASILIHHENKSNDAKGISKVSGSARIPAAVWGIAQLSGGDAIGDGDDNELVKGQNVRWLDLQPREGEKVKYVLEINPKDTWSSKGIFTFKGDFNDPQNQKKTQGELVIELLRVTGKRLEYSEINDRLNIGKSLYQVLDRLCERRLINRARSKSNPRRFVYFIESSYQEETKDNNNTPNEKSSTPPPLTVSSIFVESNSESIDNKGFEVSQQVSQQVTQQTDVLMDNKNTSKVDIVSDSELVNNIPQTGGGGGSEVIVDSKNNDFTNCENTQIVENTLINYSDFENEYNSSVVTDNEQGDLLAMYLDANEVEIIEVIFNEVAQKGINGLLEVAQSFNATKESCYRLLEVMKKSTI